MNSFNPNLSLYCDGGLFDHNNGGTYSPPPVPPEPTNSYLLLADNQSYLLLADNASKLIIEGQ